MRCVVPWNWACPRSPPVRNRWRAALPVLALLTAPGLTGCDKIDPLNKPYAWHPTQSIQHNIAAMAANPDDLLRGREQPRRNAMMETDAVERIWTNKPTPLLESSPGGPGSAGGSSGGGGGTGGGS